MTRFIRQSLNELLGQILRIMHHDKPVIVTQMVPNLAIGESSDNFRGQLPGGGGHD